MSAVLREPSIDDRPTPEWAWLPWLNTLTNELLRSDVLPLPAARLVVVSPHPDDEVLGCGGLLALHAAAGREDLVVAVTDGEASHRPLAVPSSGRLAALRRAESAEGLLHLTARSDNNVLRLHLPDGHVALHEQRLADRLVATLRPSDTVVVPWRLDGHPDHEACARAAAKACVRVGCRLLEAPIWMWHWSTPGDTRVPWHRLIALPLPPEVQAQKRSALDAHASQLLPRGRHTPPVLDETIVARSRRSHEYYFAS
jgi:LmbE family N-acetylglucosaminyl deacetylase